MLKYFKNNLADLSSISNSLIYLFISGSVILFKGTVLGPAEIGLLATVGATRVEVIF